MRASFSIPLVAIMAATIGLSGCTRTPSGTAGPGAGAVDQPSRKPGMPRPYKLANEPALALHVQSPKATIDVLAAHVPGVLDARSLVRRALGDGPLESAVATHVDLERPWDAAWVENQLVVQLPIAKASLSAVKQQLAGRRSVGRFGAVDLGRGALPGPKLAWLDEATATITFADDERGLATGREIAPTYGKKAIVLEVDATQAAKFAPEATFTRLEIVGDGSHDITITADGVPADRMQFLTNLREGALTGLLESKQIAAGASSRYAHYDRDVKSLLARGKKQVDSLPFFVKGNGEDLLRRVGSVLRSWNGRVMVGAGPKRHVLVGLGTDDPKKSAGAFYHLMAGVSSNLSLAKQFGVSLPNVRWKKEKGTASGHLISVIALENAKKHVPSEYHPLIDERGDLRVALAFPPRTGAAMLVIGPSCDEVLGTWIEQTRSATPATASVEDLVSATIALDATTVRRLLETQVEPDTGLALQAERDPTKVVVRREGERVEIAIRGPKLEGALPAAASTTPPRQATRTRPAKAGTPRPAAGSPTRTTKPTRML